MQTIHGCEPNRVSLANLPTPLIELKNIAKDLNVSRILLKRDDLTGLEVSGNKIRKLEYVIADALENGADTLVTNGGFQSNHCRATAAIGARLGLRVRLILRTNEKEPAREGNLFLDHLFGADITYHSVDDYKNNLNEIVQNVITEERNAGRKPYFFPVGASIPLGVWGYVRCMSELVEQLGRNIKLDIFCPVSSSGTYAGLVVGKAVFRLDNWRVVGIPVSDSVEYFQQEVRSLADKTAEEYGLDALTRERIEIELIDGFIGEGYAIPYDQCIDTIKIMARREGIILDPTYTGKGMTGMLETIRKGGIREGAVPLFIHTGGAFGLLARKDLFV
jgi:D-cysteine desulfhydrase